jgi:phage-related minor tail protein
MMQTYDLLITGAQNWGMALQDIAANVLRNIARQLIQIYVIEQAISFMRNLLSPTPALSLPGLSGTGALAQPGILPGISGGLGGVPSYGGPRARGGAVSAGRPYLVGERGPELFMPGASGNIVPNNAMGGVQVGSINITVENTGDQLSPAAQKQIANQVQGIVMSTLVNERRSGGVLR